MSRVKLLWEQVMEEHYTMRPDEYDEQQFVKPKGISNEARDIQ